MKTVEELLKPRRKVIADYFHCPYDLGENLEMVTDSRFVVTKHCDTQTLAHIDTLNKMPHLFRKLEWWEEREVEDMPDYVKSTLNNDHTYKVKFFKEDHCITISPSSRKLSLKFTIPATEQEYIDYIEKQKQL